MIISFSIHSLYTTSLKITYHTQTITRKGLHIKIVINESVIIIKLKLCRKPIEVKNHCNVQKKSGENHKSICEQLPFTKSRSPVRKVVLELVIPII